MPNLCDDSMEWEAKELREASTLNPNDKLVVVDYDATTNPNIISFKNVTFNEDQTTFGTTITKTTQDIEGLEASLEEVKDKIEGPLQAKRAKEDFSKTMAHFKLTSLSSISLENSYALKDFSPITIVENKGKNYFKIFFKEEYERESIDYTMMASMGLVDNQGEQVNLVAHSLEVDGFTIECVKSDYTTQVPLSSLVGVDLFVNILV